MSENLFDSIKEKEQPLAERIADQISNLIIDRQISPGQKLPNEFELAKQLNVGRGTIREAVKLLVARNVLEIRRGRGTYVAKHTGVIEDPFGFAYISDEMKLAYDLLEIRLQLEPWAASLAAERATPADLRIMEDACNEVDALCRLGKNYLKADERFHVSIARSTQNLVVPKIIPVIIYSVHQLGPMNFASPDFSHTLEYTIETHHQVLDAIRRRDAQAARTAMYDHLIINRATITEKET